MRVKRVVLQQLASAEAVLTRDERELGTAVIDIGGGTTDIAIFIRNAVQFTSVLPVGGANFTRDLAIGLQTPMDEAERIKKESGTVLPERIPSNDTVEVPGMGTRATRSVPPKVVCEILRPRAMELLEGQTLSERIHGKGLVAGLHIVKEGGKEPDKDRAYGIVERSMEKGLLFFSPVGFGGGTIKICPPLSIDEDAIGDGLKALEEAMGEVA
jgi:cell division protein FtsA